MDGLRGGVFVGQRVQQDRTQGLSIGDAAIRECRDDSLDLWIPSGKIISLVFTTGKQPFHRFTEEPKVIIGASGCGIPLDQDHFVVRPR